jgi:hypothetical protein
MFSLFTKFRWNNLRAIMQNNTEMLHGLMNARPYVK